MKSPPGEAELDRIAKGFTMLEGVNFRLEKYRIEVTLKLCEGENILEAGCAEGLMAKALGMKFSRVVAIDGSSEMIRRARKRVRLENVTFVHSLFEEFHSDLEFDTIVMCNILEHVEEPVPFLKKGFELLRDGGVAVIMVPNARSLHRRLGMKMGIISDLHELNDEDRRVGHRRVYDISTLTKDVEGAGFRVEKRGGVFLKPLSNPQMESWPDSLLDALYELGKGYSSLCAEVYTKGRKGVRGG